MPGTLLRNVVTLGILAGAVLNAPPDLHAEDASPASPPPARTTHLFFAPTARSLPRGKGSLALTEIVFPSAEVGLTDRMSIGGLGVFPLEGFSDAAIALTTKIQVLNHSHVQAAIGALQAFGSGGSGGLGYGACTLGTIDAALTVGYAYGYGQLATSDGSAGVFFLGAEKALGRSWRLIVEGYVGGAALGLPDQTLVGGARFTRGRWSVDLGAVLPIYETGSGQPFPFFTIARAF